MTAEDVRFVPLVGRAKMEVPQRCGNTLGRGHHLVQGDVMAESTSPRLMHVQAATQKTNALIHQAFEDSEPFWASRHIKTLCGQPMIAVRCGGDTSYIDAHGFRAYLRTCQRCERKAIEIDGSPADG